MFDLPRYLDRVGLSGTPSLAEMHRAHATRILFENLDPLVGIPVALTPGALQAKVVGGGRGGYCFEHNMLLMYALRALGADVEPILGRTRGGHWPGGLAPLTHLLLRVAHDGAVWHADVGYGHGTLLEPIPFGPGGPYEQSGWRYRVVAEGDLLVLQSEIEQEWRDLYAFEPRPAPMIDIEVNNWFACTSPDHRMTTRLLVTDTAADGSRTTLSNFSGELDLITQTPVRATREAIAPEDVPELLRERFGLEHPEPVD